MGSGSSGFQTLASQEVPIQAKIPNGCRSFRAAKVEPWACCMCLEGKEKWDMDAQSLS